MLTKAASARFVAIEGPPGAGVGPLAERLSQALGARLMRDPAAENPFFAGFAEDPARYAFQSQLYCLLSRYRQQSELAQGHLFARHVVTDYLFARDHLFAQITLSPPELLLYDKVSALLTPHTVRPDLVVYLTAKPEILRGRFNKRNRQQDRVVRPELISAIAKAMAGFFFHYQQSPLLVVNTSEIDFVEGDQHLDDIIAVIQKTHKGLHHYNPADPK